jgi:hypothetical protein
MDFARTTLIRYWGFSDSEISIDSGVRELAPGSFRALWMTVLTFAEQSRLRVIGASAFADCHRLVSVAIPAAVEVIERDAFHECHALRELRFERESRLRSIGAWAFAECESLGLVVIPSAVEQIKKGAFYNCSALQEVRFETRSRLRRIEQQAFKHCPYLDWVDVPSAATIEGPFLQIARVSDDDGAARIRVHFTTRSRPNLPLLRAP